MAIHAQSDEGRMLRQLIPLTTFPSAAFADLCATVKIEQIRDDAIFKKGDTNTDLVYLIDGSVTLQADGLVVEVISSDSESAKFALAHQIPRKIDAIANGVVHVIRLNSDTVNNPPPAVYNENQGYVIIDELSEDSDDWMTALLRLPFFQTLPPSCLQKILISLKTKHIGEGEQIITKGSEVNSFYLITKGQCSLSRQVFGDEYESTLSVGDSFGEEYLITDHPAKETVSALTEVSLIELEKKHFLEQIKSPTVNLISHEDLPEAIAQGAILLDVRSPQHFEEQNMRDSANIPLFKLRMRLTQIPKDKQIVVVCANGKASQAATYLLTINKFNALALKGGMGIYEPDDDDEGQDSGTLETSNPSSEPTSHSFDDNSQSAYEKDLQALKSENAALVKINQELNTIIVKIQAEKDQAEKQCQLLTQQLKKLKEILGRLTRGK